NRHWRRSRRVRWLESRRGGRPAPSREHPRSPPQQIATTRDGADLHGKTESCYSPSSAPALQEEALGSHCIRGTAGAVAARVDPEKVRHLRARNIEGQQIAFAENESMIGGAHQVARRGVADDSDDIAPLVHPAIILRYDVNSRQIERCELAVSQDEESID